MDPEINPLLITTKGKEASNTCPEDQHKTTVNHSLPRIFHFLLMTLILGSPNFTGATNRAVKIDLADNKNHWIRIQATANNTQSGSNVRLHALSVVYKPKRPK